MKTKVTITITLENEETYQDALKCAKDRDMTLEEYILFAADMGVEMQLEEDIKNPTIKVPCTTCGKEIYIVSDDTDRRCSDCYNIEKARMEFAAVSTTMQGNDPTPIIDNLNA